MGTLLKRTMRSPARNLVILSSIVIFFGVINRRHDAMPHTPASKSQCLPCAFMSREIIRTPRSIEMTEGSHRGRTGNIYMSVKTAMCRAHACKTTLILPLKQNGGGFHPTDASRMFDFSSRDGPAHPNCSNPQLGWGLIGGFDTFWHLPNLPEASSFVNQSRIKMDRSGKDIIGCLQLYVGVCEEKFCQGLRHLHNKLVVHIRQGDIFKANYNSEGVHPRYGQPPLSFYLSAMSYKRWDEVLVLSEPTKTDVSPTFTALEVLHQSGSLHIPITFQTSSWNDDFRTLMCAKNVASSFSTLSPVILEVGLVETFFHWTCFESSKSIIRLEVLGNYLPFQTHNNSPEEWVRMLLQKTGSAVSCTDLCAKQQSCPILADAKHAVPWPSGTRITRDIPRC